jgi:hypothetical protein
MPGPPASAHRSTYVGLQAPLSASLSLWPPALSASWSFGHGGSAGG